MGHLWALVTDHEHQPDVADADGVLGGQWFARREGPR